MKSHRLHIVAILVILGSFPVTAQWRTSLNPVTLVFGGDCTFAVHWDRHIGDRYAEAFAGVPQLAEADVAMVNLENALTTRGNRVPKKFNFRMQPRSLAALVSGGVDIVTLANNHVMDYGSIGLFDTMHYLDSVGVLHVGAGRSEAEARTPVVLVKNGTRLGFLAYNAFSNATGKSPGTAPRILEKVCTDVRTLRDSGKADYIVLNFHWGEEGASFPDPGQIAFAHAVIDAGADLIIGHHPHVLQGVELYRHGIIVYSLGNLIFGGNSRRRHDTMLFSVTLLGGRPVATRVLPVRVDHWRARTLAGEEAMQVLDQVEELSRVFANPLPLLR